MQGIAAANTMLAQRTSMLAFQLSSRGVEGGSPSCRSSIGTTASSTGGMTDRMMGTTFLSLLAKFQRMASVTQPGCSGPRLFRHAHAWR